MASQLHVKKQQGLSSVAKSLCHMRARFREAVFCVPVQGGDRWLRFLFASQNPLAVFFQDLRLESPEHTVSPAASGWAQQWAAAPLWQWQVLPGQFLSASVLDDIDESSVGVVMRSWFGGDDRLLSHDILQPLEPLLKAMAPEFASEKEQAGPKFAKPRAAPRSLIEEHPWLAAVSSQQQAQGHADAGESPGDGGNDPSEEEHSDDDGPAGAGKQDNAYEKLFTELEQQRCTL